MKANINIGTNKGDRMANISRAVALISKLSLSAPKVSSIIETVPWGYESNNLFLNQGLEIETNLSPELLIAKLKEIESSIDNSSHRDKYGNYQDRVIDIDLIYMDSLVVNTESVILPHPRMQYRNFVLEPIIELDPEWIHPTLNLTASQLCKEIKE